jgi:hypothetical protein
MNRLNLIGQKFGRLEVQEFAGTNKHHQSMWNCICDCGNTTKVSIGALGSGNTRSCGCLQRESRSLSNTKHGHARRGALSKAYTVYRNMKQRCYDLNHHKYRDYGGRGIKVCDRWLESFENFYDDMGDCPKGMSLDRKDNDGAYSKKNCRWATNEEQANNTRGNKLITYGGQTMTLANWARSLSIARMTLYCRLYV